MAAATDQAGQFVIASGFGPYWTGKVRKMTGSMYSILLLAPLAPLAPLAFLLLWIASRRLQHEMAAGRLALAAAAGEPAGR